MIKYLDLKAINSLYDEEILAAVSRVLDSGWYLKGEATRCFEQHYAEYIGTRYCIGLWQWARCAHPDFPSLHGDGSHATR